VNGIADDV